MSATSERGFAQHECGVALLELAIIVPVMFLLFAATVELSRGMGARNQGELFAQETAVALFHECKDYDTSDAIPLTDAEVNACLAAEIEAIHWAFKRENPSSAVIATIYRNGAGGVEMFGAPSKSCFTGTGGYSSFDCAAVNSRFTAARASNELGALLAVTGWAVVVETFVKTDGVIESVLRPLALENAVYYSVAVQ